MSNFDEIEAYEECSTYGPQDYEGEYESCQHSDIGNIDGCMICMKCGLKIDETLQDNEAKHYGMGNSCKDTSRHSHRKSEDRNLHGDLEPLGFPQDVIERANQYYIQIIDDKIYRAKNRKSIVFACTYKTYMDLGTPVGPNYLANIFSLDKKGVSNGLKLFSNVFRKDITKKYIDAIDLVPKIISDLNIDRSYHKDCIDDIKKIYEAVKARSKIFNSSNPQSIAAGIVYYYLRLNDITITRSDYSNIVKLTDITFTKIATDINNVIGQKDLKL